MRVKLDPDGLRDETGVSERQITAPAPSFESSQPNWSHLAGQKNLEFTLAGAMAGTLPLDRPLEPNEPRKLNPMHVNMVLDRCSGFKPAEIAEKYDMHQVYVNVILRHPYSRTIQSILLGLVADKMTEPAARLRGYAHEMIDVKIGLVRTTTNEKLKNTIAGDILDRAGFGARLKTDVDHVHRFALPQSEAKRLSDVLSEVDKVADVDYSQYLDQSEDSSQESEAQSGLSSGSEQPSPILGGSREASSVDDAQRVA